MKLAIPFCCLLARNIYLQVVQLEVLCQQFYQSGDPQAEKTLVAFSESAHSLPQCQLLLERSQVIIDSTHYSHQSTLPLLISLPMHCGWQRPLSLTSSLVVPALSALRIAYNYVRHR